MPLQQWGGNDEIKAKRQAEFLVYDSFPWSAMLGIGVKTPSAAERVNALVTTQPQSVVIRPDWYY